MTASVTVELPPERAFELFTERFGAREYRDGFEQSGAWPYALERFAAAAAR